MRDILVPIPNYLMSDSTRIAAAPPPPKTRKTRYCFRPGDDRLLLQAVLDDPDVFSPARVRRSNAWEDIRTILHREGILASTHGLRCRLQRVAETFQKEVAEGKQPAEYTELEKLLAKYIKAESEYEQQRAVAQYTQAEAAFLRKKARVDRRVKSSRVSFDSDHSSVDTESEGEQTTATNAVQPVMAATAAPVAAQPPIPLPTVVTTKKTKGKRFSFEEHHDVLLLKAVLADKGALSASGVRRRQWKKIETSLNRQGITVKAHTIREHLRLLVTAHRFEESTRDLDQLGLSERQQLLRTYCKKMEDEEQHTQDTTDDQSFEPVPESDAQDNDVVATANQPVEVAATSPASRSPSRTRTREVIITSEITSAPRASVVQPPLFAEEREIEEPATKRQKLELDTILERFLADQKERQQEQIEHERTRLSEQQELQRQTVDLQKRALDIQEKAMNMQERLMALMEKVMDKLS
ncbi:hypothetical protein F443_18600 [Phytophthora nicotianae P1569]|uniref:Uncharacterized protein n=1 Tax=Phytophthora nicotianae P1569 TaxID=1317065 RepID=V9E7Q2_PHYNI|nr:hypothetical protein F443_18600 [Phytophthora nicotianae P1569]